MCAQECCNICMDQFPHITKEPDRDSDKSSIDYVSSLEASIAAIESMVRDPELRPEVHELLQKHRYIKEVEYLYDRPGTEANRISFLAVSIEELLDNIYKLEGEVRTRDTRTYFRLMGGQIVEEASSLSGEDAHTKTREPSYIINLLNIVAAQDAPGSKEEKLVDITMDEYSYEELLQATATAGKNAGQSITRERSFIESNDDSILAQRTQFQTSLDKMSELEMLIHRPTSSGESIHYMGSEVCISSSYTQSLQSEHYTDILAAVSPSSKKRGATRKLKFSDFPFNNYAGRFNRFYGLKSANVSADELETEEREELEDSLNCALACQKGLEILSGIIEREAQS